MNTIADGIVDNVPTQTFQVYLSNFSNHIVKLPNKTGVGLPSPAPGSMSTLGPQVSSEKLHPKEGRAKRPAKEEKPTTSVNAETAPSPNGNTNWKENITICFERTPCMDRILDLLDPFSTMWSGQVVVIKATQHRINLVSGPKPIHQ